MSLRCFGQRINNFIRIWPRQLGWVPFGPALHILRRMIQYEIPICLLRLLETNKQEFMAHKILIPWEMRLYQKQKHVAIVHL